MNDKQKIIVAIYKWFKPTKNPIRNVHIEPYHPQTVGSKITGQTSCITWFPLDNGFRRTV